MIAYSALTMRAEWIALVIVLVGCGKKADGAPPPIASTTPPAIASSQPAPQCDADALWSDGFPDNGDKAAMDAHEKAFGQKVNVWSADCRHTALVELCGYGCPSGSDYLSDTFINAFPVSERVAALKFRLDRNTGRDNKWRTVFGQTKGIVEHALAIQGSARSSAYTPENPTTEQLAEQLVNGDPCMRRMKADDAKIDAVGADLQREDTMMWLKALVFAPLQGLLGQAHSCGDCSDDRYACKGLRADLKKAEADLLDFEKELAADRKALATAH